MGAPSKKNSGQAPTALPPLRLDFDAIPAFQEYMRKRNFWRIHYRRDGAARTRAKAGPHPAEGRYGRSSSASPFFRRAWQDRTRPVGQGWRCHDANERCSSLPGQLIHENARNCCQQRRPVIMYRHHEHHARCTQQWRDGWGLVEVLPLVHV